MCGRFFLDVDFDELYRKFILHEPIEREIPRGEIFPTDAAPVILAPEGKSILRFMRWGLTGYGKNQRLINARSETLLEKPRFARLMDGQRCIIPASAFYEWERQGRQKIRHTFIAGSIIFFAGLYEALGETEAFTILTMPSAGDVARIHDRMPIALPDDMLQTWINPQIHPVDAYEQLMMQTPLYTMRDEGEQLKFL